MPRWKPKYRLYDLRHSYASHLANRERSPVLIGKLMGHSRPETTAKYMHAAGAEMRNVTNDFVAVLRRGKRKPPKSA